MKKINSNPSLVNFTANFKFQYLSIIYIFIHTFSIDNIHHRSIRIRRKKKYIINKKSIKKKELSKIIFHRAYKMNEKKKRKIEARQHAPLCAYIKLQEKKKKKMEYFHLRLASMLLNSRKEHAGEDAFRIH